MPVMLTIKPESSLFPIGWSTTHDERKGIVLWLSNAGHRAKQGFAGMGSSRFS